MANKVHYEWDIELVSADEHEDIIDHNHRDTLADFGAEELLHAINRDSEPGDMFTRLVLIRDEYDIVDDGAAHADLVDRSFAYVENGELPTHFENGVAVPKRFAKEFAR